MSTRRVLASLLLTACCALAACGDPEALEAGGPDDAPIRVEVGDASQEQMVLASAAVLQRLEALGVVEGVEVDVEGDELHVVAPGADEGLVREALDGPSVLEFRPVLVPIGQTVSGAARDQADRRVEELRAELALPDDVTATRIYDALLPDSTANEWGIDVTSPAFGELYGLERQLTTEVTPSNEVADDAEVVLATEEGEVYRLGPVALTGAAIESAEAGLQGNSWAVSLTLRPGPEGIDGFNAVAGRCYAGVATCPPVGAGQGQLAIVWNGVVLSAPTIQQPTFARDQISISGSFDERSATVLAAKLASASKPVELRVLD